MALSTDYTETLKKIKETEEATNRELLDRRKRLEDDLRRLEAEAAASIAEARSKGDAHVAEEVERARGSAQSAADALLTKTAKQASAIAARRLDNKELKKVVDDTLFSEFE